MGLSFWDKDMVNMMEPRDYVDNYDYSDEEIDIEDPMEELFDSSDLDESDLIYFIRFLKKKHGDHHAKEEPKTKTKDHQKTHRLLRIFIFRFLKKKAAAIKAAKPEAKKTETEKPETKKCGDDEQE